MASYHAYEDQRTGDSENNDSGPEPKSATTMHNHPGKKLTICTGCGSQTSLFCSRCQEDPFASTHQITYYCSQQCQKNDWGRHKDHCTKIRARKHVYRASQFLQKLFLRYREVAFDKQVVKLEPEAGFTTGFRLEPNPPNLMFTSFPSGLVTDEFTKNTLLCSGAYGNALDNMHEILKMVLEGVTVSIQEVAFAAKATKFETFRKVDYPHESFEGIDHFAWHLTLPNDTAYVLDITGHSIGFSEAIMPLAGYLQQRGATVLGFKPFGYTPANLRNDQMLAHYGGTRDVTYLIKVGRVISKQMTMAIQNYLTANNATFRFIFELSTVESESRQRLMIVDVVSEIERVLEVVRTMAQETVMKEPII